MSKGIKLTNFMVDKSTGVHLPPGKQEVFGYSDGAEDKILNILKKIHDRSTDSMELELAIDDWPTKYHFSNLRTNIIRALDFLDKESRILEIGAGCGALTRYFGENFKSVDAIEGNFQRAYITRERCQGLDNVQVYCSPLQELKFNQEYDVVTLIGVLEYAPYFYSQGYREKEEACLAMVQHAMSALKEDGMLIIAIENKLGLKYWSGCREDHTGRLFDNIHGYPRENIVVTFSKREIEKLLDKAQLRTYEFYYPFPDYKLTNTMLREVESPGSNYLYNWITVPFEDYSGNREFYFNESLALRSLVRGEMIYQLSNSFVIAASAKQDRFKENGSRRWIAKRFSTNRVTPFRTVTVLEHDLDSNSLLIQKRKLFDVEEPKGLLSLRITDSKWIPGDLLQFSLCEAIYKENAFESFINIFRMYHKELMRQYSLGIKDKDEYPLISGDAIDFLPCNIIVNDRGMFAIDHEWICNRPLSADYILFRGIFIFTCDQYQYLFRHMCINEENIDTFTISIIRVFYPQYDMKRQDFNRKLEEEFQSIVSGSTVKIPSPEEFRILKDPLLQKEAQILQKEAQINAFLNSWSWKITRPLRWVYRKMLASNRKISNLS